MFGLNRGRLAIKYLFFELLPTFLFALVGFVFLITMVNMFKLGEYIIVHGAKVSLVVQLVIYMVLSTLPVIFPMAMLFAVLLTYGRLSQDSEIVALKSLGLGMRHIATPAVVMGGLATFLSAQVSFNLVPWGNRKLEDLKHQMTNLQPMAAIREGVFSEGFFDLVVYANKVDSKSGTLQKVFIYDESGGSPLTIVAPEGQIVTQTEGLKSKARLKLIGGDMHRSADEFYTKIDFDTFYINLFDDRQLGGRKWGTDTLSMSELTRELRRKDLSKEDHTEFRLEWHRRWSLSVMAAIFAIIGVGLGTVTNRRAARASGVVLSISIIVAFWIVYAMMENVARKNILPLPVAVWLVVVGSLILGFHFLRKAAKT